VLPNLPGWLWTRGRSEVVLQISGRVYLFAGCKEDRACSQKTCFWSDRTEHIPPLKLNCIMGLKSMRLLSIIIGFTAGLLLTGTTWLAAQKTASRSTMP
jgi:hypothetical protein